MSTATGVTVGKVHINALTMKDLMEVLDRFVEDDRHHFVAFCDSHLCARASVDPELGARLARASLILPDGVAMTTGARLLGGTLPERLPGPDVMLAYCRHSIAKGRRHFLFGGGEGVAEKLKSRLEHSMPGIHIVGSFCPPFRQMDTGEERDVKRMIEESGADVLWVGLGAPKQELWMEAHLDRIDVPLMLGVGAAFDFHSGTRRRAPGWVRGIGLEWLFRMATGGRRVLLRNAKWVSSFAIIFTREAIKNHLNRRV